MKGLTTLSTWTTTLLAGLVLIAGSPPSLADGRGATGLLDGTELIDLLGEDALKVEISIHKSLLQLLGRGDQEVGRLVSGLDSIHAVVFDLEGSGLNDEVRDTMAAIDRRLRKDGWERLAMVREGGSRASVLVRNTDQSIDGLIVMVVDGSEVVFASIAGHIDLEKIRELGDQLDVPGLDELELGE